MSLFEQALALIQYIILQPALWRLMVVLIPFVILIELPFYVLMLSSILYNALTSTFADKNPHPFFPFVSCVISAYAEGELIKTTLYSLMEQLYPGTIEIIVVVDDAATNIETLRAIQEFMHQYPNTSKRIIHLVPKATRGGHASSMNLGIKLAKGEYVLILDADTSCDNDLIKMAIENFRDPNIVGVSGMLRVRNAKKNLLTTLQAIEYLLGIHMGRIGLSALKTLNIISGAFGVFRRDFLIKIGGWKNGSAEDLDLTIRMQAYFQRYPNLRVIHDSRAVAHTEEGDMFYIYCRRHWRVLRPKYLGWPLFIVIVWSGLLLHIIMPIALLFYFTYLIFVYPWTYTLGILMLGYFFYLILSSVMFVVYLLLVSERKVNDTAYFMFLPLMPFYQLAMRLWAGIALIYEIIFKTHKDSKMAPWWVIRKTD
jgi:poly-beta-1,6-N-acetyl-D-glucosamine synthase